MKRSYYNSNIKTFLNTDENSIIGELTKNHSFTLEELQRNAWSGQIKIFKDELKDITDAHLFFEYSIPRMGKRVDAVLIIRNIVFIVEFKVGENKYPKHAIEQVIDYSFDLKNFHSESHQSILVPILICTEANDKSNIVKEDKDQVYETIFCNKHNIRESINSCLLQIPDTEIVNPIKWGDAIYKPTPTIIQAAQALYKGHNVEEISRSDSGAINLDKLQKQLMK